MSREVGISEGTKAVMHTSHVKSGGMQSDQNQSTLYGRVVAIALTVDDQLFKDTNALEAIKFEPLQDTTSAQESGDIKKDYLIAYKKHSAVKTPILNEIVSIELAPDLNSQVKSQQYSQVFYYDHPISVFNSSEHNATPDENTINEFLPGSKTNQLGQYKSSTTGIKPATDKSSTITNKDKIVLGDYFEERGVKPLSPLEGDHKLEGRFGNSLRFGGTPSKKITKDLLWSGPVGNPITILRNGQVAVDSGSNIASLHEDINGDGSSLYMLQGHSIELVLGSNNFDSYGQKINNAPTNNVVKSSVFKVPDSQSLQSFTPQPFSSSFFPLAPTTTQPTDSTPKSDDLNTVPNNEDDFNFVQIGDDIEVPLTQGVYLNAYNPLYKFTLDPSSGAPNTLTKIPRFNISHTTAIAQFAGKVSQMNLATRNGRALIDLIALTEGTMGAGNFNGYDITVGGYFIPGFTMVNSAPPHPNIPINISQYKPSTAAGRYQFLHHTWVTFAGPNTLMSRYNQDYACWKLILGGANVPTVMINKIDTDFELFKKVINMMAQQWASLPVIKDPKGLYGQAGRFTFDTLYTYYKSILSKYP